MNNQPGTSILQVNGLSVSYGNFHAVRDVSFDVKAGEIFGFLGPNGAGKTSTLSAVEGLLKPQSGTITVAGFNTLEKPFNLVTSIEFVLLVILVQTLVWRWKLYAHILLIVINLAFVR